MMNKTSNYVYGNNGLSGLSDFEPGQRALVITDPYLRGPDVKYVQRIVGVKVDGLYGPITTAAVMAFQRKHGLAADGKVTGDDWQALKAAKSGAGKNILSDPLNNLLDWIDATLNTGPKNGSNKDLTNWINETLDSRQPQDSNMSFFDKYGKYLAIGSAAIVGTGVLLAVTAEDK